MADVFTIDDLNALAALTAADEVPVWDSEESGEPTKKITAQNMTNSVKTLGSLVNTTEMNNAIAQSTADVIRTGDVVNNLTSTATDKPLSAAQGKALNEAIAQSTAIKTTTFIGTTDGNGNIYSNRIATANYIVLFVDAGADYACTVFVGGSEYYNYHISSYSQWNVGSGKNLSLTAYYIDK